MRGAGKGRKLGRGDEVGGGRKGDGREKNGMDILFRWWCIY